MSFILRVLPVAINDIQLAYDWYEEQSTGLGENFLESVDDSFLALQLNPFYKIRYDTIRCLPLRTFPYMIHYSIDETREIIFVSAVLNMKRSPDTWQTYR